MRKIAFLILLFSAPLFGSDTKNIDRTVDEKIASVLKEGHKVSLMILPGRVTNALSVPDSWHEGMRIGSVNSTSSRMLRNFSKENDFSLVDRASVNDLLEELHFQSTGAVSPESAKEIGRLSGATHMLIIDWNRYQGRQGIRDDVFQKLIEIESGQVIAISNDTLDEKGRVLKKKN